MRCWLQLDQRFNWWLRTATSGTSTAACGVGGNGFANSNGASDTGVRPLP